MKKQNSLLEDQIFNLLREKTLKLSEKYSVSSIDLKVILEKIINKIKDADLEIIFKESISIEDRLESLKKILINKKLGDLTEEDSKLIEETLFLKTTPKITKKLKSNDSQNEEQLL